MNLVCGLCVITQTREQVARGDELRPAMTVIEGMAVCDEHLRDVRAAAALPVDTSTTFAFRAFEWAREQKEVDRGRHG